MITCLADSARTRPEIGQHVTNALCLWGFAPPAVQRRCPYLRLWNPLNDGRVGKLRHKVIARPPKSIVVFLIDLDDDPRSTSGFVADIAP